MDIGVRFSNGIYRISISFNIKFYKNLAPFSLTGDGLIKVHFLDVI